MSVCKYGGIRIIFGFFFYSLAGLERIIDDSDAMFSSRFPEDSIWQVALMTCNCKIVVSSE